MSEIQHPKKYEFKAEVKQLLDILVHSLYTSRDIFLRELISNASDALDKIRFESLKGAEYVDKDLPLEIRISFDEKNNTLTITDTGIGMSRDELIANIGTIAKSGSAEFLKQLADNKSDANNIIGKFGVGFYSVFMVAKEVVIKTRSYNKEEVPVYWKSDGLGDYEISELTDDIKRGTAIEVHLKDEAKEFAQKYKIESIIKKYSNFITFPIYIDSERINTIQAIWREQKSSVKPEQYKEFYQYLSYDNEEPMDIIHKSVDAPIQFYSLMFIPKKSFEFFRFNREDYGLDLYVRRVLIQHKNKELLPEYLSFVKGVVDSEDLPLNISRETLQENVIFHKISGTITSQVLAHLSKKAEEDKDGYAEFWKEHGRVFKLGYTDFVNAEKYTLLLRFNSSFNNNSEELTSFEEYVSRRKEGQKEIFYAFGTNRDAINLDPRLEIFKSKGIEVFYLFDPVDEFVLSSIRKYKDYDFKSIESTDLKNLKKFEDTAKREEFEVLSKDDSKHFDSLLDKIKNILGDKVKEVKESTRLIDSPACLVNPDDSLTAQMQKLLKLTSKDFAEQKKILEINKDHRLIRNLLKVFKSDSNDEFIKNSAEQLYDSALLMEGSLEDPHVLVNRINKMLEESSSWYVQMKNLKD